MRALVGTLVVLAILLAGCSDGVATQSEMPVPVPSHRDRKANRNHSYTGDG